MFVFGLLQFDFVGVLLGCSVVEWWLTVLLVWWRVLWFVCFLWIACLDDWLIFEIWLWHDLIDLLRWGCLPFVLFFWLWLIVLVCLYAFWLFFNVDLLIVRLVVVDLLILVWLVVCVSGGVWIVFVTGFDWWFWFDYLVWKLGGCFGYVL